MARLLALAHKFQGMLDRGEVESMAELARVGRVPRARITQIMDAGTDIQEHLLLTRDVAQMNLLQFLAVALAPSWVAQRALWQQLHADHADLAIRRISEVGDSVLKRLFAQFGKSRLVGEIEGHPHIVPSFAAAPSEVRREPPHVAAA